MQDDGREIIAQGIHGQIILNVTRLDRRSINPGLTVTKIVQAPEDGIDTNKRPHNVILEVKLLQQCAHPNIVTLLNYQYIPSTSEYHLSLPLLAFPLTHLLSHQWSLSELSIISRSVVYQALSALDYLHKRDIAHRDICPNNMMIDWDGTLRLIDLGTAYAPGLCANEEDCMECQVGTGPYRPPEILFGPKSYDARALDIWALGTVLAEFFVPPSTPDVGRYGDVDSDPLEDEEDDVYESSPRTTLFDDSFGVIGLAASIFKIRGSPNTTSWPEFRDLPDSNKVHLDDFDPTPLSSVLPLAPQLPHGDLLLDLLESLLALSPSERISADAAIVHPWLAHEPILVSDTYPPSPTHRHTLVTSIDGAGVVDRLGQQLASARSRFELSES